MAEITLRTTFKLRRGTSEEWTTKNPILAEGEPGFEIDTGKLKIGNGVDAYTSLNYIGADHFDFSGDDITIVINSNRISLKGFDEAEEGTVAQKINGALTWVKMLSEGHITELLELKQDKLTSSDDANKIRINEDNTMEITAVSVGKLDDTVDNLILNGGNA